MVATTSARAAGGLTAPRHALHDSAYALVSAAEPPAGGVWVDPDRAQRSTSTVSGGTRGSRSATIGSGVRTGCRSTSIGRLRSVRHRTGHRARAHFADHARSEWRTRPSGRAAPNLRLDRDALRSARRLHPQAAQAASPSRYVGDSQRTVLRSVATDPAGGSSAGDRHLEDGSPAAGARRGARARDVASADYGYDREDRQVSARLWQGAPGASASQSRSWSLLERRLPDRRDEPEASTSYLGWDALGNLRSSRYRSTTTTSVRRLWRRSSTAVGGCRGSCCGATRAPSRPRGGDPDYGAIVEATHHNRFGSQDVLSPPRGPTGGGGRRERRATVAIGVLGRPATACAELRLRPLGNPSHVDHPHWSACRRPRGASRGAVERGSCSARSTAAWQGHDGGGRAFVLPCQRTGGEDEYRSEGHLRWLARSQI